MTTCAIGERLPAAQDAGLSSGASEPELDTRSNVETGWKRPSVRLQKGARGLRGLGSEGKWHQMVPNQLLQEETMKLSEPHQFQPRLPQPRDRQKQRSTEECGRTYRAQSG